MVCRRVCLHADKTGFEATEQFQQLVGTNFAAKHGRAFAIDP